MERWLVSEDGKQKIYRFPNDYGASVINYGYGSKQGREELAVIKFRDGGGNHQFDLCYDTPITSDVLGWLTPEDVRTILTAIEALPPHTKGE